MTVKELLRALEKRREMGTDLGAQSQLRGTAGVQAKTVSSDHEMKNAEFWSYLACLF